ncbi:chloride channel protein [Bacillus sp. RO2]|uniref:chloride channel protein n=1 Tax=Bacillus sp. RO2 TaxID=2723913 RepID=UPI0032162639
MFLKYKNFFATLAQWSFFGSIIGLLVGSITTSLLKTNDYLGDVRLQNDWLILLLPFGGIIIGYLYMNYGKVFLNHTLNDTSELNNLVIDAVHGEKKVPMRMGPIVYIGTFITVILGGSTGREGAAIQMGSSVASAVNNFFKVSKQIRHQNDHHERNKCWLWCCLWGTHNRCCFRNGNGRIRKIEI